VSEALDPRYDFLSFVRRGAAADLTEVDALAGPLPYRGKLDVEVTVDSSGGGSTRTDTAAANIRLYGPLDAHGVDPRHVVRTEPRDGTTGFEPNYLAAIEFHEPDFPWLLTPAAANGAKLRPWVALIVLADGEYEAVPAAPAPLASIVVHPDAIPKLPKLEDSWAWAHAQVSGGIGSGKLEEIVAGEPGRVTSRLVCPRQLARSTSYTAFLVPAFADGVLAGLGKPVEAAAGRQTDVAWHGTETAPLSLPYYQSFAFRTSDAGDFESLVRMLTPRALPATVGTRAMAVDDPGWGLPSAGGPLGLSGALRAPSSADTPWSGPEHDAFQARLAQDINAGNSTAGGDPAVVPPLYGRWHAARSTVSTTLNGWLDELSLDPRWRTIAGLGTQVVLDQRSQLMASAWQQVAGIDRANQLLRQAQLARAASGRIFQSELAGASESWLLALTGPLHSRLLASPRTVAATLARTALPVSAVSSTFRRVARTGGALRRREQAHGGPVGIAGRLARGELRASHNPRPGGLLTLEDIAGRLGAGTGGGAGVRLPWWLRLIIAAVLSIMCLLIGLLVSWVVALVVLAAVLAALVGWLRGLGGGAGAGTAGVVIAELTPSAIQAALARPNFRVVPGQPPPHDQPQPGGVDSPAAAAFRAAATTIAGVLQSPRPDPVELPTPHVGALAQSILPALDPELTIPPRIGSIVTVAPQQRWEPEDPIAPIMAAPKFPQPMYAALRDISQDLLLPGAEQIPPDTLGLLVTNEAFIEAHMVGLNHQMARELLWAEYPTDQRGTYFRQFWDVSGYVSQPGDPSDPEALAEQLKDIPPIPTWSPGQPLGEHSNRPDVVAGSLVLLIRGELLRRYPTAMIYAAQAVPDPQGPTPGSTQGRMPGPTEKHPLFRGTLAPDITFVGFDLDAAQASGSDGSEGWFFVFQQQPSEPRFGFEPAPAPYAIPAVSDWNDLTWANFAPDAAALAAMANAPVNAPQGLAPSLAWPSDSAGMASATMRRPVRVAIHADQMLPRG